MIGEEWGKIDVEKAAALDPDLIVGDWWPVEKAYSGMEDGVEEKSKKIASSLPSWARRRATPSSTLIEGYAELAESLGADAGGTPAPRPGPTSRPRATPSARRRRRSPA